MPVLEKKSQIKSSSYTYTLKIRKSKQKEGNDKDNSRNKWNRTQNSWENQWTVLVLWKDQCNWQTSTKLIRKEEIGDKNYQY